MLARPNHAVGSTRRNMCVFGVIKIVQRCRKDKFEGCQVAARRFTAVFQFMDYRILLLLFVYAVFPVYGFYKNTMQA